MAKRKVFTFGLEDPRTAQIRYVGISYNAKGRLSQSKDRRITQREVDWLTDLKANGLTPTLSILATSDSYDDAIPHEQHYIALFRSLFGYDTILNDDAGDGLQLDIEAAVKKSILDLHMKEKVPVVAISSLLDVSKTYVRSIIRGELGADLRDEEIDTHGMEPSIAHEKQRVPVRCSLGITFSCMADAAKFYNSNLETILNLITAQRVSRSGATQGIQFFYATANVISRNKTTAEEERARLLARQSASLPVIRENWQDPNWRANQIAQITAGIDSSQRSATQAERMKDPAKREQISQTMTGKKYEKPRRTRPIKCSNGIIHETTLDAADYYGVHSNSILKALTGVRKTNTVKTKTHGKVSFTYADQTSET